MGLVCQRSAVAVKEHSADLCFCAEREERDMSYEQEKITSVATRLVERLRNPPKGDEHPYTLADAEEENANGWKFTNVFPLSPGKIVPKDYEWGPLTSDELKTAFRAAENTVAA